MDTLCRRRRRGIVSQNVTHCHAVTKNILKIWVVKKFHYISRNVVYKFQAWEYSQSWELRAEIRKKKQFFRFHLLIHPHMRVDKYLSTLIWGLISKWNLKNWLFYNFYLWFPRIRGIPVLKHIHNIPWYIIKLLYNPYFSYIYLLQCDNL